MGADLYITPLFERSRKRGYFRDPYNDNSLLWHFGMSWWTDIIPMLDEERYLPVAKTREFIARLKEREGDFERTLDSLPARERRYLRQRYRALLTFLETAVKLDSPIECSL